MTLILFLLAIITPFLVPAIILLTLPARAMLLIMTT